MPRMILFFVAFALGFGAGTSAILAQVHPAPTIVTPPTDPVIDAFVSEWQSDVVNGSKHLLESVTQIILAYNNAKAQIATDQANAAALAAYWADYVAALPAPAPAAKP